MLDSRQLRLIRQDKSMKHNTSDNRPRTHNRRLLKIKIKNLIQFQLSMLYACWLLLAVVHSDSLPCPKPQNAQLTTQIYNELINYTNKLAPPLPLQSETVQT